MDHHTGRDQQLHQERLQPDEQTPEMRALYQVSAAVNSTLVELVQGGDLERRALEALVLEEFRAGRLSKADLQPALGFEVLNEVDGFLKAHGVFEESERETQPQPSAHQAATGNALVADFRAFRRGRTLGGLDPKELAREGLR
jgi:hypothetical protein